MDLTDAQLALVSAARTRQPGALRALALSFDGQLADEDAFLDGAVAAWQVVGGRRTRARTTRPAGRRHIRRHALRPR